MLVAGPLQGFGKVLFFVISAVLDNLVRQDLVYIEVGVHLNEVAQRPTALELELGHEFAVGGE